MGKRTYLGHIKRAALSILLIVALFCYTNNMAGLSDYLPTFTRQEDIIDGKNRTASYKVGWPSFGEPEQILPPAETPLPAPASEPLGIAPEFTAQRSPAQRPDRRKPLEGPSNSMLGAMSDEAIRSTLPEMVKGASQDRQATINPKWAEVWKDDYVSATTKAERKANPDLDGRISRASASNYDIPQESSTAMINAAEIFKGDAGLSQGDIYEMLSTTGALESNFKYKKNQAGGSASSYWQVMPDYATEALKNAPQLFGKKFKQHFRKYYGRDPVGYLKSLSKSEMQAELLNNQDLAAAMATSRYVRARQHKKKK